ncbi:MAG TPA: serine/threonine-protein kinase [Haliangiales bacterium]|nr:serine/threonine-protein kinase [Haliangiales bacterium]
MERSDLTPTLPSEEGEHAPERGAEIGRFLVLGGLGMGGMGMVLAAYDPHLDRKVALKMLRGEVWRSATTGREMLIREAQAMARLTHPNVVAVHDVGFSGADAYVAMELVEGSTLREWLAAEERRFGEILDVLAGAGAGLAAAHAAGIVHQDFKPDNVLVGRDGRPRVSDFGLAGSTVRGAGTKGYMAPEQEAGCPVDARADQYAFCVTFWEALAGELPPPEPAPPRTTRAKRAPRWVYRVLARGLARDPERRWPSMDALLAALRRRKRLGASGAIAAGAVVAVGLVAFAVGRERARAATCDGAEARLAGVWDATRREAVRQAFAAAPVPYRDAAWQAASARIDGYAGRWAAMVRETCRATRVEGRQSDTLMDLRMACLERRRAVLGDLTALWARGTSAETVERAVDAAGGLPPLAECADARALTERAPLPADPAARAKIATVRARLDGVEAMGLAGRRQEARKEAAAARVDAEAIGWAQLRAEAAYADGEILVRLSDSNAEVPLLDAVRFAGESRDDRLAARALIELVNSVAANQQKAERAALAAEIAEGAVRRAGGDPWLRGSLLRARGEVLLTATRYADARAAILAAHTYLAAVPGANDRETLQTLSQLARVAQEEGDAAGSRRLYQQQVDAMIPILGPEHPRVATALSNLALSTYQAGDLEAAAGFYRRALAIKEKVLGPDAKSTAFTLNDLGMLETVRGNLAEASALLERALAIRERGLGPTHALVAMTLDNLAALRRKQGRAGEAMALLERALAITVQVYGEKHASVAFPLASLGLLAHVQGDAAGALAYNRRALELREQTLGRDHPLTLESALAVAGTLAELHRCDEARPLIERAVARLDRGLGPEDARRAEALIAEAECELAGGRAAPAAERLERAVTLLETAGAEPAIRGSARWLLARALSTLGRRDEAVAAALKAEQELGGDADGAREVVAVREWLARRRPVRTPPGQFDRPADRPAK